MKSESIRKRLESRYFITCTDQQLEITYEEFDSLQEAYKRALLKAKSEKYKQVELTIDIENNSEDELNVVKSETIYIK